MEETKAKLQAIQNQMRAINVQIDLREPLAEELQEMREFLFRNV